MGERITWEQTRYGSQTGYIYGEAKGFKARIELFSIIYTSRRADVTAGTPYLIQHRLPFRGIERKFANLQGAQKHAERYLLWSMELMGFTPIDKGVDA